MEIEVTELRLSLGRPLAPWEATLLRGHFGRAFADETALHHHRPDGTLVYDYPRVQFKVVDRTALLVGLAEGGEAVERVWREADRAVLGGEELPVLEATLTRRREALGECGEPRPYRFASAWLGLNQENHRRHDAATTDAERRELLGRVLVGNCLSLAKSLGLRVAARLAADASGLRPVPVRLKGVPMLGFVGTFAVNFALPAGLGLGKSVSRGFGTIAAATPGVPHA
jgi:hypothetical protein